MLRRLLIKNIALIENQIIEFGSGLSVFSGETGAGKSLIIDSILLVLGARADKTLISYGKDFAYVEALFDGNNEQAKNLLNEYGIEEDESIIVSRKIWSDGRSENRINGSFVTVKMLKQLASLLVDVYGQFENQTMFESSNQMKMVDSFADCGKLLEDLSGVIDEIKECDAKLDQIVGDDTERERQLDMLSFQINEIEAAGFYEGEEEELKQKHTQIVGREKVISSLSLALDFLDKESENDASDKLKSAANTLDQIVGIEDRVVELKNKLTTISYDVKDVIAELEDIIDAYNEDETDIDSIEERLDLLNNFKRKYGATITEINAFCERAKEKYNLLIDSVAAANKLKNERENLVAKATAISNDVSAKRKEFAAKLSASVEKELTDLGMKSAKFEIVVTPKEKLTKFGMDEIQFLFSANSGIPLRPLEKVASGGELSRFMLALKTIFGKHLNIGTMIFDEIDTGISGATGHVVGQKMYTISALSQVICVSHLAQIVAIADANYLIEKKEEGGITKTTVHILDQKEKIAEIARLVGGKDDNEQALVYANELINSSNKFKNTIA